MHKNTESRIRQLDKLLNEVEESSGSEALSSNVDKGQQSSLKTLFSDIDSMCKQIDQSQQSNLNALFYYIDSICNQIDEGVQSREEEVKGWSVERKRKEKAAKEERKSNAQRRAQSEFRRRRAR